MLIKSADDKSQRLKLLEHLQSLSNLDGEQKKWLSKELWALREGMQGEKDAAYYIDAYYGDNPNWAVLHDLRIVVDDEVAQIDHLLIGRTQVFLLETKNFNGNVHINAHGEFTVSYAGGKRMGIASPLEQSMRHEKVLLKLLRRLGIRSRTGGALPCQHVVMFHPKVIIERPKPGQFDTSHVIKADALRAWHERFAQQERGPLKTLTMMLHLRSQDTVREWAEKIARRHCPQDALTLLDFMQSAQTQAGAGLAAQEPAAPSKRLICSTCGAKISYAEGKFCWNHAQRFGGKQYCRAHQEAFPR